MKNLKELTLEEQIEISGGDPDVNTSVFYDIGWYVGATIRHIESWFK